MRARIFISVFAALTLLLAGCASERPNEGATAGGTGQITVGVIPGVFVAPVFLGIEKGFFKEEGLKVEPQMAEGGAAIVPGVVNGSYDVGFSDVVSLTQAAEKGLPIKLVGSGNLSDRNPDNPFSAITVRTESSIRSAADLQGKTVAVNVLENSGELTVKAVAENAGIDPNSINFIELPFPEMNAARAEGRVDAVWSVEPFLALGDSDEFRTVIPNYYATDPNMAVSAWFARDDRADSPEIRKFKRGISRANEYAQAHPDEVRQTVSNYLDVPPDVAADIGLSKWSGNLNMKSVQRTAGLMAHFGFTDGEVDVSQIAP